jgi:hypothetical protein
MKLAERRELTVMNSLYAFCTNNARNGSSVAIVNICVIVPWVCSVCSTQGTR